MAMITKVYFQDGDTIEAAADVVEIRAGESWYQIEARRDGSLVITNLNAFKGLVIHPSKANEVRIVSE